MYLSVGLTGGASAQTGDRDPTVKAASAGVEYLSDHQIQARAERSARTADVLKAVAAIESYQGQVGHLGQILGKNFSIKRLGMDLEKDEGRVSEVLRDALTEADASTRTLSLTKLPADRLSGLFNVDDGDFDGVFLASEIQTTRQALTDIRSYETRDLSIQTNEAVAMASDGLERRLAQAENLQRALR